MMCSANSQTQATGQNEPQACPNTLCIVVPCHNEEATISAFLSATDKVASEALSPMGIAVTYVFVDDGSADKTARVLKLYAQARDDVSYLIFTRNFGKESALYAGLSAASELCSRLQDQSQNPSLNQNPDSDSAQACGRALICVMDADLQDPPTLLPKMCAQVLSGQADRAAAYRVSREGEPPIRSWFAHRFYQLMNRMSDVELRDGARDFSVMSCDFVAAVLSCGEYNRFTKGLFGWVGYTTTWTAYENVERVAGETNWSFFSLVRYALDGLVAYSTKPLEFFIGAGLTVSAVALLAMVFVVIRAALFGDPVSGWPSLMTVTLFLGGLVLLGIGVLGLYLSKIYTEVKRRPIYLVRESNLPRDFSRTL